MLEDQLMRQFITEHAQNTKNRGRLDDYTVMRKELNPGCGDLIELFIKIENNKIIKISYEGRGCALSQASTSILTEHIKDMPIEEIKKISEADFEKIIGFNPTGRRRKCAFLSFDALTHSLSNLKNQ